MDKLIARLNIELFQRRLAGEQDEARRRILLSLLAKEEEKLRTTLECEHAEAEFEIDNKDQSA
jgi:hypothetical protein